MGEGQLRASLGRSSELELTATQERPVPVTVVFGVVILVGVVLSGWLTPRFPFRNLIDSSMSLDLKVQRLTELPSFFSVYFCDIVKEKSNMRYRSS